MKQGSGFRVAPMPGSEALDRYRRATVGSIDPALDLIWLQAGSTARREMLAARTRNALARVSFGSLTAKLRERRLLPLVGERLIQVGEGLCPPQFEVATHAARAEDRARGLAVLMATQRVSSTLKASGIPCLPLKGPLLAEAAHGDMGLRGTADIDLLVPREALWDAAGLLQAEGYEAPLDRVGRDGLPDLHLAMHHPRRPSVEVHWRVHWYESTFSQRMLERAENGPDGLLRARPDDLLTALLLFYGRDGFHGIRMAADVASWWDRHGHSLEPEFLASYARSHPALAPALTAATEVVESLTGTPARAWLGPARAGGRRSALGSRLADWTQEGDRDQLAANISLAGALLGPPGSVSEFARRELIPSTGSAPPHAAKMVARYAVALWRLRRGRTWAPAPPEPPGRIELYGMPLDMVTEPGAIAHVMGSLARGQGGWVITPNLNHLRQFVAKPELRELFEEADLVVADGMPLVWASVLASTPLPARVAGSDLVWSLTAEIASQGRSIFLLGGAPGAAEQAATTMWRNYPGLRLHGMYCPPFGFEDDLAELAKIRSRLREAQPDVVYVALSFPKQEHLIRLLREDLPTAWFVGVGISFSFLSGDVARAPDWLQRAGLEWLHRLATEPRRLGRRYLVHGLPFAVRLAAHSAAARARGGFPTYPAARDFEDPSRARVTFTHGSLERRRADDLAALRTTKR